MKKIFLSISAIYFLFLSVAFSQNTIQVTNNKANTTITYKLHHPAHEVEAKSNDLMVKIEYDKDKQQITKAIANIKVSSFDSGNSSRDSHAMEAIEALKFPNSTFKSTGFSYSGNTLKIYGDLTFHGVTKNITIDATQKIDGNTLTITGNFGVSLDKFKVERPSLLFVPTDEYLMFNFSTNFSIK
jgi:polyisoprenoid-binding protein YceI